MPDPRYVPVNTLKDFDHDEVVEDDQLVLAAILAAEAAIDNELGRQIIEAGSASARVYAPGPASRVLWVHDCTTITSITEDGTTVPATDWQAEPLNNLSAAGETVPYTKIRRLDGGYWYSSYGKATVSVTATWGWAEIPPEIVEACKILAKDILANRGTAFGLAAITNEAGGVAMRRNPVVAASIAHYQRVDVVPA